MAPSPSVSSASDSAATLREGAALDTMNEQLLSALNKTGEVFLSHTRLNDSFAIRLAVGNLHTTEVHVGKAWELLQQHARAGNLP